MGKPSPLFVTDPPPITPSGVADLLMIKQQIKRYEAGEIADIRNVMKGEENSDRVRRKKTTDTAETFEKEQVKEEERDLQSTEHFDLKSEVESTIKVDASLKTGASLSGSYGGSIDFKTYVDGAISGSKEESKKHAESYSKDVTTRAASKVSTRIREVMMRRTIEEFEQETLHGLSNGGLEHVVGIYQWVDKIYEAQVYNYGRRLLYDFMIPEPAAFLVSALKNPQLLPPGAPPPEPPPDFTLTPEMVKETNYMSFVAKFRATEVEAPDPYYKTFAKTFSKESNDDVTKVFSAEEIDVSGYECFGGSITTMYELADEEDSWVAVAVGDYLHVRQQGDGGGRVYFQLPTEWSHYGKVAIGGVLYKVKGFAVTVELACRRSDANTEAWRLQTFGALQKAYLRWKAEYDDQMVALAANAVVAGKIAGRNPARNAAMIRTELKRGANAILTNRAYEDPNFGAVDDVPIPGQPAPAKADAKGKIVRFFEQAFEWEQMLYVFYSYFWGRHEQDGWKDKVLSDDTDPHFADFLRAGWARVTVPVRPWFENAVAQYVQTGAVWEGGDVPNHVNSPLYVSILTEIQERLNKPGEETPQGMPWEVRVPTQLVKLRAGQELPQWKKDKGTGDWVPQMKDPQGKWVPET